MGLTCTLRESRCRRKARRLLWGSDALPVLDFSSYTQTYSCLRHIPALSEDDLAWILGKTAEELFQPRYAK